VATVGYPWLEKQLLAFSIRSTASSRRIPLPTQSLLISTPMNQRNTAQLSAKEIFILAVGLESVAEQEAVVNEYCSAAPELKMQVQRLLAAAGTDLGESPLDAIVHAFGPEQTHANPESNENPQPLIDLKQTLAMTSIQVGGQIDRYRLMEQLGEGGMGVVYVAEQVEPVRRKVALKVIKPGMDSKQVIARFEAERQTLALMDHMNIARVLDGGTTEQGLPYFVMELVRGLPITSYCDQANASTRERLELFNAVCSAVHHAHQKGIIHRDIKPGNVLVTLHDGKPVVKVIDFGVAKALNQPLSPNTVYTALNQVVGTPLYMSPEQMELSGLDIDIRSDIYSMGVLLYELLTGTTPFDRERLQKSGFDEMRRIIREEEPPRPSHRITTLPKAELSTCAKKRGLDDRTFTKSIQHELDWITLKALEKDRNRRYESSSAFGADVQRYLDDETVLACPPSLAYRVKKMMRRHRVLLTTGSLVIVASLIGTSVSIWQAVLANKSKRAAVTSNAIARQAVDDMYTQFAEKWLSEEGNASQLQHEFLEKAATFYEADANQFSDDPTLAIDRLKSRQRVCNIQIKLGQHKEAEAGLRDLIQRCRQRETSSPARVQFSLLELNSTAKLASLLATTGKNDAAKIEYSNAAIQLEVLAGSRALDAKQKAELATVSASLCTGFQKTKLTEASEAAIQTSLKLWNELRLADPNDWNHRIGFAEALRRQGVQRMWFGDRKAEAESVFLEAKNLLLQLLKDRPRDRTCRDALAGVYINLGVLAGWARKNEQKMEFEKQGLELARGLVQDYPTDQQALRTLSSLLGNHISSQEKYGSTLEKQSLRKSYFDSCEKLVELFPTVIEYVWNYRVACLDYSRDLYNRGEKSQALTAANNCKELIGLIRTQGSKDDFDLCRLEKFSTLEYVALLLEEGRYLDAIKQLEKLDFDNFSFNPSQLTSNTIVHADIRFLNNCQDEYWTLKRPCTMIRECFDLLEKDALLTVSHKRKLMASLQSRAEHCEVEAQKMYDTWCAKLDIVNLTSEDILGLYQLFLEEGDVYSTRVERRHHREAIGRLAMDLVRKMDDVGKDAKPNDLSIIIGELTAGEEYQRDPELALRLAKRAIEMGPNSEMARQDLGWALFRNGAYEESLKFLGSKVPKQTASENAAVLAMTLWHLGRKEEAAACLDQPYDDNLTAYITRRKKDPEDKIVWPTADNLLRMDREAKELLGDERTALAAAFADDEEKSPTVSPKVLSEAEPIKSLRAIAKWQYENHLEREAEESLSELIRLQPTGDDRSAWKARGDLHWRSKRFEEALNDLNYVLETAPDDQLVLFHRSCCYRDLNRFPEALSDATRLIELTPTGYRRWLNRAEIYEKMKQPERALADIQKALEVSAGTFDPWYEVSEVFTLRGRVYLEGLADSEQAIADFTHALERNLFSGKQFSKQDIYLLRAAAYDLQGDSEKAKEDRAESAGLKR
jgi:serine/threonine protein kinase/Flp pilus assembly protein TadD